MSIFKLFSGKSPEALENKGDGLYEAGLWGKAKLIYEQALDKLDKSTTPDLRLQNRLQEKHRAAMETLAREHQENAESMMEAGGVQEARELVLLAMELSRDKGLRVHLEEMLSQMDAQLDAAVAKAFSEEDEVKVEDEDFGLTPLETEQFQALCGTLPEAIQSAYLGYGGNFMTGYLALNSGDFEKAAAFLNLAMEEDPSPESYISMELATAYLNLNQTEEARQLLEYFIEAHPDALPAYQMLCEIYWDEAEYGRAATLLSSVPPEVKASTAVNLLTGETLHRAGRHDEAAALYRDFLERYGWHDAIALALAKNQDAAGDKAGARDMYQGIIKQCTGCGTRVDPFVKQRYADLCYESGMKSMNLLEMYLALAKENPTNAADYYQKVSRIYAANGYEDEARRFQLFANKAAQKTGLPGNQP